MMSKFIFFIFSLILFSFLNTPAFAEKIESFDVKVQAQKDGKMYIIESINYDFESSDRHGIYRYIPIHSMVGDLYRIIKVKNVKVEKNGKLEKFVKSQKNDQIYLKIGDPDKTITGLHNYVISYTVENGIGSNFPEHDEIYWNGTGNGWDVPIENATIAITNDFGLNADRFLCFTGSIGSKDSNCSIYNDRIKTKKVLNLNEGLTAVAVYPKDSFPPSILSEAPPQTLVNKIASLIFENLLIIWLILNFLFVGLIIYWYRKFKNKKRFGKPVVNFEIPKDNQGFRIMPALAGIIDSAKLERDDVVATLFDLAIRRYIKIEEIRKVRKFLPDESNQKITKLKDSSGLDNFEKTLLKRLFKDGDYIFVKDLKKDFYKTFQELEKDAFNDLVKKKYFIKNPKNHQAILIILAILALFTANLILSAVLFYLSKKLTGRTPAGDEIDYKIDGLKIFLKSMDRNYKWQAEKFYTVEAMIPYAMSLGYIDKFMEQLKLIKPDYDPKWYDGYKGNFFVSYSLLSSSLNSSITTTSPSSSGAGGGGFSGGGGGGGGGGSW